jgi:lysophospholipase L1-like esterase
MKKYITLIIFFFSIHGMHAQTAADRVFKFDLGTGKAAKGYVKVQPGDHYTTTAGYGFDFNSTVKASSSVNKNSLYDYVTSNQSFFFSVKLPEGNYNVKVILGDQQGTSLTTVKAECRRLMLEKVQTAKGQVVTKEFTVHIRDSMIDNNTAVRLKPREIPYLHWDEKLTLEFSNKEPKVCAVEISPAKNAVTMFLAGNSTVVDQAEEPYAAWGQMIPSFFEPEKIAVANYAESGETLKAFRRERRLDKLWSMAKPCDYLFIEFAHNDQKPGGNHLDPFTTYKETLKQWIAEARQHKMIPVLVTSMHRRSFDAAGHIINTLSDYPEAMRQVAKEESVALIDLNAMSKILYEAWGPENSIKAFVHYAANTFPGQKEELKDDTHFNAYGAYELAKCIVNGIRAAHLPIAGYLKKDGKKFDPAYPDPVDEFSVPHSAYMKTMKPDGS